MAKLIALLLYLNAVWSTLVVPCAMNPSNWKYCMNDWGVWLWPEVQRGIDLYTGSELPYSAETGILSESPDETK